MILPKMPTRIQVIDLMWVLAIFLDLFKDLAAVVDVPIDNATHMVIHQFRNLLAQSFECDHI